jgi:predicted RNase H-like HicB family nuclease
MIEYFIQQHLAKAKYKMIDNKKTFYGEVSELRGVWATGKTLEECRQELKEVIEGWIILRLKKNLPIPNFKTSYYPMKLRTYA